MKINFLVKYWKNVSIYVFIIFSLLGTFKIINSVNILKVKNHKNKIINDYAVKLKNCFDLKNKNKRRIYESLELIKYCVKEFGIN